MPDFANFTRFSPTEIRYLEQLSYNALPALQTLMVDGWLVRLTNGYTCRANSVNSIFTPHQGDVQHHIEACEAIYASQNQDTVFKMTAGVQPADLDKILNEHGYDPAKDHTLVQTCQLSDLSLLTELSAVHVHIEESPSQSWFEAYCTLNNLPEIHRSTMWQILQNIIPQAGFIRLEINGAMVGVALGVVEQNHVGLFDIVVAENERRQGLGSYLVHKLMQWGNNQGATIAYLQVVGTNVLTYLPKRSIKNLIFAQPMPIGIGARQQKSGRE